VTPACTVWQKQVESADGDCCYRARRAATSSPKPPTITWLSRDRRPVAEAAVLILHRFIEPAVETFRVAAVAGDGIARPIRREDDDPGVAAHVIVTRERTFRAAFFRIDAYLQQCRAVAALERARRQNVAVQECAVAAPVGVKVEHHWLAAAAMLGDRRFVAARPIVPGAVRRQLRREQVPPEPDAEGRDGEFDERRRSTGRWLRSGRDHRSAPRGHESRRCFRQDDAARRALSRAGDDAGITLRTLHDQSTYTAASPRKLARDCSTYGASRSCAGKSAVRVARPSPSAATKSFDGDVPQKTPRAAAGRNGRLFLPLEAAQLVMRALAVRDEKDAREFGLEQQRAFLQHMAYKIRGNRKPRDFHSVFMTLSSA